ncbi:ketopantoate reductase family protein [Robertmurraya massiliosenegalensis]|uniref:ketopantoate reductase family protein n=1 Tax=Robertmurraya massiliosenegalensis TaxID=1287657 RepID=UPI00031EEBBE|nr:ketopantoate reductase family protein [Robertmurraya massiliosenegalensis]
MKILVVGAGAVGGYFGGRLVEKGEDVTFLVRERRKKKLEETGLKISSVHGDIDVRPKLIVSGEKPDTYDVIILSTKAYHLNGVIEDIRPYVDKETMVLPLLNGISHLELLAEHFGKEQVIGGLCFIESTLDENGTVVQTSPIHNLIFGEQSGEETERIMRLTKTFADTKANFIYSGEILKEMWQKYLFISCLSGATTLMRSPIGPIRETKSGFAVLEGIVNEVVTVMETIGAPISKEHIQPQLAKIKEMGYEMKSSMQRDMEKGMQTEADHFFLYLLKKAQAENIKTPFLELIYANLKVYEKAVLGIES